MIEIPKQIYQEIKYPFITFCLRYKISANAVTIANHVLTLTLGCYFFSRGTYIGGLLGLGVCLINGLMDYLDGDLARIQNEAGELGKWLDSGFDVVIQNAVMGAIGIGVYKMGMPLIWVVMFFIGNSACNFVSFHYNKTFGFDSANGNEAFRSLMTINESEGLHRVMFNYAVRDLIDPTSNGFALGFYTYRYWIALGAVIGGMPQCFAFMTFICNVRWVIMYVLYAYYLADKKGLHAVNVLKRMDDENEEFYGVRSGGEVRTDDR